MDIELRHIHKHFGPVHANNDISFTVKGGRIVGVLGENGAGKSTLMKILSGYQPADSGDILLDGVRAAYHRPEAAIAAGIGMLQQDPLDIPAFTVLENLVYGQPGGLFLSRKNAQKQLGDLCGRFGFALDADAPIVSLSIGQRQQLEIVRLLALGIKTLILDEPTTGISAEQKDILFDALRKLSKNEGMSVLLVSHKLEDVIALCDEVVVLRAGKLVGDAQMPVTKAELVRLMFGQELAPQTRAQVPLGQTVVSFDKVTLRGKRVTVENFALDIRAGEVIGLAGLDGSGQELIARACAGLIKPQHGTIRIAGKNMAGKPYRDFLRSGVAFGAAGRLEEGLIAGLTLTEHIALTSSDEALVNWPRARDLTETQLKLYNVRGRSTDTIERLSGGNQQRVLMALLPQKPVLLALEQPTRGLDVDSARWIWQQLLARRASGTAILFTSPDLDELVAYSDRILVLYAGKVYEIADAGATTIDELGHLIGGDFQKAAP
ncbi:MAG TPA: ATP-binding cassette domain-containing protein [Phototrophicaceae bacterium]|nr:ATP-binding cassette domain-containing protein [Phototrophicaceae bacterium]